MKRRFAFRLARVLRIRALEEQIARSEWGAAQAEANRAAEHRANVRASLDEAREQLKGTLSPGSETRLDPRAIELSQGLLDQNAQRLRKADERLLTREGQAERLAAAWRERDTRRQALERLETRDLNDHRRETERDENKDMDERSSHTRRNAEA